MAGSLYSSILGKALKLGFIKAQAFCTSAQLRGSMRREVLVSSVRKASGRLHVPEYWAPFYHLGRKNMKPISANNKKYLVWFPNKNDDPRLIGGKYPVKESDVIGLQEAPGYSKERFKEDLKAGRAVVSKVSPRAGGSASFEGNRFFGEAPGEGLSSLQSDIDRIAEEETEKEMERFLNRTGLKHRKVTTTLSL